MKYSLITILALFLVISCTKKEQDQDMTVEVSPITQLPDTEKAQQLLNTTCYVCHSPSAGMNARIAPPMEAVKRRYQMAYSSEKDFIEAIISFTVNPGEDSSIMPGAVDKFGVMPVQNFKEEDMRAVAKYIYQNELPQPEWFEGHFRDMHPDSGMKMRMRKRNMMGMD